MSTRETLPVGPPVPSWRPLVAVLPAFVITRLTIFLMATAATDSQLYYQYGVAARVASVDTFFRVHDVEYPQLAVLFMAGVGVVADALPTGAERVISARPDIPINVGLARFQVALGLVLGALDMGMLIQIARLARTASPCDPRTQTWRLGVYVAATAALGPIMFDRLDLVVGAAALFAVSALGAGRPLIAYALLTAGAAFKLVPVLLFPLFVLSAAAQRGGRFWPAVARESGAAFLVLAAWPVLAVLFGGGDRAFVYVKYHAERGVELGSSYAAPLLLVPGARVGESYSSRDVRGPFTAQVAKAAQVLTLVAVGAAVLVAGRAIRRSSGADRVPALVGGCVLVWLAFVLTNKVGSPQYLLWIAPLVPLLPLRTGTERIWAIGFVTAGLLATLMYPYLWPAVHGPPVPDQPDTWAGPTAIGFVLLFARWSVVIVLTGYLAYRMWWCHSAPELASCPPTAPNCTPDASGQAPRPQLAFHAPDGT